MATLSTLFIGDIVGRGGRQAVQTLVPELKTKYSCSFSIANAENSAAGAGLNRHCLEEMSNIDAFTTGDHVWDCKEFVSEISGIPNVVRPANFSKLQPGNGWIIKRNPVCGEVIVVSLLGKVFMRDSCYCPFETMERLLTEFPSRCKNIFVDFHAEATSEKIAMARFLDGKVTAVLGTHTHVQTADAKVMQNGTAFISDVGMVGSTESILGRAIPDVLKKFRTGMPCRFPVVDDHILLSAVVVKYDSNTGHAISIESLQIPYIPEQF